jgi:hypothetical protein
MVIAFSEKSTLCLRLKCNINSNEATFMTTTVSFPAPTPMRAIVRAEDKVNIFEIWQKGNGGLFMYKY